jgi:hypothetical protein
MTQAQSDARMRHAMRTLQGVHTRLTAQGYTTNHARARSYVGRAITEVGQGLRVR